VILEKLCQIYPELSKSQRKLADYVARSYPEAAFMTASRLAHQVGVDEATVIRFAQRLGYPGYPGLLHDIRALVQQDHGLSAADPTRVRQPLVAEMREQVALLEQTCTHLTPDLARRALDALRLARRIYISGQGMAVHVAGLLATGLLALGCDAHLVNGDAESLTTALTQVTEGDLWVSIASRASAEIACAMDLARKQNAQTLAIVASPTSPIARAADMALICPETEDTSLPTLTTAPALVGALLQALATEDPLAKQILNQKRNDTLQSLCTTQQR
jgi:DNA-binding MurR/RpiR family transcriptional regulator